MAKSKKKTADVNPSSELLILNAYLELCYEIGVAGITLQKIADRAGVAFGTVRYYFAGGEKNIHEEAFKLMLSRSYQIIEDMFFELRKNAKFNPVEAYVETMFRWITERPAEGSFLLYFYYLSSTKVPLELRSSQTVEKARLRVEGLIHEAIGKGLYKPIPNTKECAATIHSLTIGFGFIALTFGDRAAFLAQKKLCVEAVSASLRSQGSGGK